MGSRSSSATTARKARVPLDRALSKLGLASRTEARALITAGRVRVDGAIATDIARMVIPERVAITIDNTRRERPELEVILLHKPRGVVTTKSDPQGRPTVYDSLTGLDTHVVPVGRLDLATSGLLILTNDTRLADWLTDPATAIARVYLVTVRGRVAPETTRKLERGFAVDGEHLAAVSAVVRKASGRESHLVVTLDEGKNREIRRLLAAAGHPVTRLRRAQYGGLELGTLAPGKWRRVTDAEISRAFPGAPKRRHR
ncbi:MAG: pseudouridine synthase [Vicinamibacterales bacterium]